MPGWSVNSRASRPWAESREPLTVSYLRDGKLVDIEANSRHVERAGAAPFIHSANRGRNALRKHAACLLKPMSLKVDGPAGDGGGVVGGLLQNLVSAA